MFKVIGKNGLETKGSLKYSADLQTCDYFNEQIPQSDGDPINKPMFFKVTKVGSLVNRNNQPTD